MYDYIGIAKSIKLHDNNGYCCQRAMGGICYEHGQLSIKLREAYEAGLRESNPEIYKQGWIDAFKNMQEHIHKVRGLNNAS